MMRKIWRTKLCVSFVTSLHIRKWWRSARWAWTYYRNLSPHPIQKAAFERQLDLAEELDLPIVIHNRDAYHDILPILQTRRGKVRRRDALFFG